MYLVNFRLTMNKEECVILERESKIFNLNGQKQFRCGEDSKEESCDSTSSSDPKWVLHENDKSIELPFLQRTLSLGSHDINYSVDLQESEIHTETEIVQCKSRSLQISGAEVEGEDSGTGLPEPDPELDSEVVGANNDDEENQWEDIQEHAVSSTVVPEYQSESRKFSKLMFDPKLSQQKRREYALQWQKKRRDQVLDKIRNLEGDSSYSDSETEDSQDFVQYVQQNATTEQTNSSEDMEVVPVASSSRKYHHRERYRKRRYAPPLKVMLSEWLIEKPEDFEDKWIGVLCPAGKRCMVVANRGKTRVYSRREEYLGVYASLLPGGRKVGYSVSGNRSRGVTILDCIWSEKSQVFYVLDLICWNSHSCNNCDTDYRQFFLASKFHENPELLTRNQLNPFPFIPLPYFTADNFGAIMTSVYPPFPDNVDGVLFFYKEAFYISDTNPLCLWVRLSDVSRRLAIDVSPELLAKEEPEKNKQPTKEKTKDVGIDP